MRFNILMLAIAMLLKGNFDAAPFGMAFVHLTVVVPLVLIVISVDFLSRSEAGTEPRGVMLSVIRN
jgi:hypothetical protein